MLNIPYEVKRALKKGDMRKNYKMKVYHEEENIRYDTIATLLTGWMFGIDTPRTYRFYNPNESIGFTITNQGTGYVYVWHYPSLPGSSITSVEVELKPLENAYTITYDDPYIDEPLYLQTITELEPSHVYDFTIDNDNLVAESVKIDERMVTGKQLKFGLCEGSSLEFQYFDHPNINGKDVQVYCSVEYVDGNGDIAWYDIPMGWYTVDQCPMQWETGIYKVMAYNKLKSDYLDQKANELLLSDVLNTNRTVNLYDIQRLLLKDYQVESAQKVSVMQARTDYVTSLITKSVKFSANREVTPINRYNLSQYGYTYNNNIYLAPSGHAWRFILDEDEYYTLESSFNISDWEWSLYLYIKSLIDNSGLTVTGDAYINWLHSQTNGWRTVMMVELIKSDDTVLKFSDLGYAKSPTTYAGGFADIMNRSFTGCKEIRFWLGSDIMNGQYDHYVDNVFYTYGSELFWGSDYSFRTSDSTEIYNTFKFLDGSDIPKYNQFPYPDPTWIKCYCIDGMTEADKIEVYPTNLADFTLRDIVSANYEINCQYGKLDRETDLFTGVELNQGGLLPADNLYPANDLYPQGDMEHPFPSSYQKLWTDTVGEQSFRYLFITYKTTETVEGQTQEVEKVLQRTVNTNGTTDYNMSDNWLFRNLIWTDEDVGDYADAMVTKMQDIRWFPFEMWAVGMPYIETGDAIEITDKQGNTHMSYVLTRTLNGIQNLQDTFVNGELNIF